MFKLGWGQDIGIDLGTATVIAFVKGKGNNRAVSERSSAFTI